MKNPNSNLNRCNNRWIYYSLIVTIFYSILFNSNIFAQQKDTVKINRTFVVAKEEINNDKYWIIYHKEKDTWELRGDNDNLKRLYISIGDNLNEERQIENRKENDVSGFEILTDQDLFAKGNEDRDYTMGVRFLWYGKKTNNNLLLLPCIRSIADIGTSYLLEKSFLLLSDDSLKKRSSSIFDKRIGAYSFDFGESAFTPYHIEYNFVDSTDRPYAAILNFNSSSIYEYNFGKTGWDYEKKNGLGTTTIFGIKYKSFGFRSRFTFGIIGKTSASIAEWTQTTIHSVNRAVFGTTRVNPEGWHLAIGGEKNIYGVNYDFSYFWNFQGSFPNVKLKFKADTIFKNFSICNIRIPNREWLAPFSISIQPNVGSAIGTIHDYLQAGVNFEMGFFNYRFTQIANFDNIQIYDEDILYDNGFEFSFIVNIQWNYWFHNTLLQGAVYNDNSPYSIEKINIERITSFINYGGRLTYKKFTLGYLFSRRSNTLKFVKRNQNFGRVFMRIKM